MKSQTRRRIDAYWSDIFDGGGRDGPVITAHRSPGLIGYPGIYGVLRNGSALISAPPDLVGPITAWRPTPDVVIDPAWWHRRLPGWSAFGPSVHAFTDQPVSVRAAAGLRVQPAEPEDLAALRAAVDPSEWGEGGFAGDDVALAWRAVDEAGDTVAAANLTPFDRVPADVGVLTVPRSRGRGAATLVAAVATRHAVAQFGIARWRARTANTASRQLAARLGFEPDCRQFAIRPA